MNVTLIDQNPLTRIERDYEFIINELLNGKFLTEVGTGNYLLMCTQLKVRNSHHVSKSIFKHIKKLNSSFYKNEDGRWVIE